MPLSMTKARTANAEAVDQRDERHGSEHDEEPATAALGRTGTPEWPPIFPSAPALSRTSSQFPASGSGASAANRAASRLSSYVLMPSPR